MTFIPFSLQKKAKEEEEEEDVYIYTLEVLLSMCASSGYLTLWVNAYITSLHALNDKSTPR